MTVCERGDADGFLRETISETGLDTDEPRITFSETRGRINPNLTIGVDVASAGKLRANDSICHDGVKLHGKGFIIRQSEAAHLGLGRRPGAGAVIRTYFNGRDLNQRPRGAMVIDLFGLDEDEVRLRFPEIYQHLLATVKPVRDKEAARSGGKDAQAYAQSWWIFGKPRQELRPALVGLTRYIATVDTATHRIFQFLPIDTICDDKVVIIASDDSYYLGILSSSIHVTWSLGQRTRLGQGDDPVYVKKRCFAPFPFPAANEVQKQRIRLIAEELDAHRKRTLADHSHLTLTAIYNILEKLRSVPDDDLRDWPAILNAEERRIFDDGLVLILKELHNRLDAAVADAYGWPVEIVNNEVLIRLVDLNKSRLKDEAKGVVSWLRPDYQIPRLGSVKEKAELDLVGGKLGIEDTLPVGPKPSFPIDDLAQNIAITTMLAAASSPLDAFALAAAFKQGRRIAPKIVAVLAALSRMGFLTTTDGGRSFLLRRAA